MVLRKPSIESSTLTLGAWPSACVAESDVRSGRAASSYGVNKESTYMLTHW